MAGRGLFILALALFAAGGFGVWRMQNGADAAIPANKPAPRVPVTIAEARRADVPVSLSGLGVVQPLNIVTVRSRVDGAVEEIGFEEGRDVRQGDLLVQIDPRPYKATLDQAKAKKLQDEAQLANVERDLGRAQQLAQNAYTSRQTVDGLKAQVAQLKAQIAGDDAMIESAQTQLDYTTIRAPMDGRAGFRLVDKGNLVRQSDQTGIVTLSQITPITAVFTLPERDFPDFSDAMKRGPVPAVATAPDGRELAQGEVSVLNNEIDRATGTFKVKATFANADRMLWPGQSVRVRTHVDTLREVVTVPEDALQRGPQGAFAFVMSEGGKAELRSVEVARQAEGIAVVRGLEAGERVVTAGASRVQNGSRLEAAGTARAEGPTPASGAGAAQ